MAFWVEFRFSPPLWVHAILWPAVTLPLAVLIMRPVKAALVAAQFRHPSRRDGLVTSAYRRFLVPGLSTLIMLVVLLGLGTWQVYRLQWKEGILARIAAAEAAPAVPLGPDPAPYTKVSVTGRFRFDQAAAFGAEVRDTRTGPTMGFYQIVPLDREDAPTILVDRGWVPQKREIPLNDPTGSRDRHRLCPAARNAKLVQRGR